MSDPDDAWKPCGPCGKKIWAKSSDYWANIDRGSVCGVVCADCMAEIFRAAAVELVLSLEREWNA